MARTRMEDRTRRRVINLTEGQKHPWWFQSVACYETTKFLVVDIYAALIK